MIYTPIQKKLFPWILFRIDEPNQKNLYLTFDDGPDPYFTQKICDVLERYNAKASFFAVGEQIEKYPNVIKNLDEHGHVICNHSYRHRKFYDRQMTTEIKKTQELISSVIQKSVAYYRPPFGRIYPGSKKLMHSFGLKVVLWDVFVPDYKLNFSRKEITKQILKHSQNGSIILLHDRSKNASETLAALSDLIKVLLDQGFLFKTLPKNNL